MSVLWLRVALGCYAVGLLYALVALTRTAELLNRIALHAAYLGMVFHFVSLVEAFLQSGAMASVHNAESVLGFLIMVIFLLVYLVYQTTSLGIVVFPLVFLLTFIAATGEAPFLLTSAGMRTMVVCPHRPHFHRLRGAGAELRRQLALPGRGACPEIETIERKACSPAGPRSHRRNRIPFSAPRFSVHDSGLDCRHRRGAIDPWPGESVRS